MVLGSTWFGFKLCLEFSMRGNLSTPRALPQTNFPVVVWKYPTTPSALPGSFVTIMKSWDLMITVTRLTQLLPEHQASALLSPPCPCHPALWRRVLAPSSTFPFWASPGSPFFSPTLLAFTLLSPQLFHCRQATKKKKKPKPNQPDSSTVQPCNASCGRILHLPNHIDLSYKAVFPPCPVGR